MGKLTDYKGSMGAAGMILMALVALFQYMEAREATKQMQAQVPVVEALVELYWEKIKEVPPCQ